MAADLSSNKNLWVLISGTAVLKSEELVGSELERNTDRITKGTDYYKCASNLQNLSKDKNDGSIDISFLKKLSSLLSLEINQTYDIMCTYLLYEYKGSNSDIQSILKNERHTHSLMLEIWNYYYSERLYSLLCLKQLLSHWQDSSHAYQSLYEGFLGCVNSVNSDAIIESVLKQLENNSGENIPSKTSHGSLMTELQVSRWAKYNLSEMAELLQIVLLFYKDVEPQAKHVNALFKLFQKQVFGLRHPYRHLIDGGSDGILKTICHLEVLVLIEAMELEWLYRCQNAGLEEFYLFKDKELFSSLNLSFSHLGSQPFHGPILLSWMLVIFYGGEKLPLSASQQVLMRQLGAKALKLNTFGYLLLNLQSPIFSETSVIGLLAHQIVYGLLSLLLSTYEESTFGENQDLFDLACQVLKQESVAADFFKRGLDNGVGVLLSNLIQSFPTNFSSVLKMLSALGSNSPEHSTKVIELFQRLPYYSEFVDEISSFDIAVTSDSSLWQLVKPKSLYAHGNFVIKNGTKGQLVQASSGKQMIQWNFLANGWQMCYCEVYSLLQQAALGSDRVSQFTLNRVLDIVSLCQNVIKPNHKSISILSELTNLIYALAERFSTSSPSPNLLIANCMNVIGLLAENDPAEAWSNVLKMGILPYSISHAKDIKNITSFEMSGGVVGNLIASQEYMHGTYAITKAFLQLISAVSSHLSNSDDQHFLACVMLVVREIFPTYHRWRYSEVQDRNIIGKKCLDIFHKLLTVSDKTNRQKNGSTIKSLVLHALLFTDLGLPLLQIIENGNEAFNVNFEDQFVCGNRMNLLHVVRLSLSVLNRLLLLKSVLEEQGISKLGNLSSAETIISSQPTSLSKKRHIVLTVAQYIFHRFDPRLTTLAVHLLKRFAKEIPISLLACLGNDAEAIRDMFLVRLQSMTEDIRLKVSILDFLSVCIHQQPGLFEMFVNPSSLLDKKDAKDQFSCLQSVLDIFEQKKEGESSCRPELHLAAVRFVHSLWYGKKSVAISALKKNKHFWSHLCSPLFDDAKIDNTVSHILKILSLEFLYYTRNDEECDPELTVIKKNIAAKKVLFKWSTFVHDLSEFADVDVGFGDHSFDSETLIDSTFLLSAWRDFLIVIAKQKSLDISNSDKKTIMSDLLDFILNMVSNPSQLKILYLLAQLYYILLETWKTTCICNDSSEWFSKIRQLLPTLVVNLDAIPSHIQLSIISIAMISLKLSSSDSSLSDQLVEWIIPTCAIIKSSTKELEMLVDKFTVNLPTISVLFLEEILSRINSVELWIDSLRNETIIQVLLSVTSHCLQAIKGPAVIQACLTFFLKLAENNTSAETLSTCGLIQQICLPISHTYSENTQDVQRTKWIEIYSTSVQLMTLMLKTLQHFFLEDAIQFVGVHMDRMHQSLQSIKIQPSEENLNEGLVTCDFLAQMVLYQSRWQINHQRSFVIFLTNICSLTQILIAYLIRPNYLQHIIQHKKTDQEVKKIQFYNLQHSSSIDETIETSPVVFKIQCLLLKLLSICLSFLRELSPPMLKLISEQSLNVSEWTPILQIGFGTPSLDQDGMINFGTMISCINVCLRMFISKSDSISSPLKSEKTASTFDKTLLIYILENSLSILISQAVLYQINPNLSDREKQLIKRELGTELTSFTVSLSRHMRKGSGAPPSPGTASTTTVTRPSLSPGKNKNLTTLTEYPFIKLIAVLVDKLFK